VTPVLNPCCSNPRARNLLSSRRFTVSSAQPRSGQASSASITAVEGENRTGASPQELVVDPDPRSKSPVITRSQIEPMSHKVSKNRLNSSLWCHRINRQSVWCSMVHTSRTPASSSRSTRGAAAQLCRTAAPLGDLISVVH
jgi:hypothetical protein